MQSLNSTRKEWIDSLWMLASPVLEHGAQQTLKAHMPVAGPRADWRAHFTHLEAVARTLAGIAPWLELQGLQGEEHSRQRRACQLAQQTIISITDRQSVDFLNFSIGKQPLVDAAHLALAILRAPRVLWAELGREAQKNTLNALAATRNIMPYNNNWILFSAIIEATLCRLGQHYNATRIDKAFELMECWYVGDGLYADGPVYHADYYNSYIIHPFMLAILNATSRTGRWNHQIGKHLLRSQRYCELLERSISPEGAMPVTGRSLSYRCGNLHLMAQLALLQRLPQTIAPAQARCAMDAVIKRTLGACGTFNPDGWLNIGLCGNQPALAEEYISTGSLYMATLAFLPIGLSPSSNFWSDPDTPFSSQSIYAGDNMHADSALKNEQT